MYSTNRTSKKCISGDVYQSTADCIRGDTSIAGRVVANDGINASYTAVDRDAEEGERVSVPLIF